MASSHATRAEAEDSSLVGSGADIWADQPSHPPPTQPQPPSQLQEDVAALATSSVDRLVADIDEFDPFSRLQRDLKGETAVDSGGVNAVPATASSDAAAPAPPAKQPPSPPSKDGEDVNQADLEAEKQGKGAPQQTAASSSKMTTSSSLGLGNPLASIASAFRRTSVSSSSGTPTSSSQPQTPVRGTPTQASVSAFPSSSSKAPSNPQAMLIRDKDDMADIDESEKSAPPAIPSQDHLHRRAGDGNTDDEDDEVDDAPPFDFNLFLEQMRSRAAEPIAKYLRSFLKEFGKRQWGVGEQIRVINDFLDFIAVKMRENEVWRNTSDREFDNAVEAMEKLVMNRVYHLTFIPALAPAQQASTQTDDLERDHVLKQRIKLFNWVSEKHLDLPLAADNGSFLDFAKQELLKVNAYKAPRDKLICILNCCKVIFGLMRHLGTTDGADTFIPFLILVVLRANPEHLISNVQYIQRFRNPERLAGENGYYLSSLNGAISFIETMDSSSLSSITQQEFEAEVEKAIASLPPDPDAVSKDRAQSATDNEKTTLPQILRQSSSTSSLRPPPTSPRKPMSRSGTNTDIASELPPRSASPAEATREFFVRSTDNLQKTVSKPLQALGRILTDMGSDAEVIGGVPSDRAAAAQQQRSHGPWPQRQRSGSSIVSPTSPSARRRGYGPTPAREGQQQRPPHQHQQPQYPAQPGLEHGRSGSQDVARPGYHAADYLDDSVSAEQVQAEADRHHRAAFAAKIGTLVSIFPGIEKETLEIVLLSNGEDVERSIEGLLEMA